jgi:hypothetical protein
LDGKTGMVIEADPGTTRCVALVRRTLTVEWYCCVELLADAYILMLPKMSF